MNGRLTGKLIFKWRIISYDIGMHKRIGSGNSHKSRVKPHFKDGNDMNYAEIIPLSFDLTKYGSVVNKEYIYNNSKVEGVHYQYTEDILIFIHKENARVKHSNRYITIFKNGSVYGHCLDILLEDGTLTRKYDNNLKLFIDNERCELKWVERVVECLPIKNPKMEPFN
jgi:hypothetical protein